MSERSLLVGARHPGAARDVVSAGRRHSRFVALSKRLLPALALGMLLLVAAWPRVDSAVHAFRIPMSRLDVSAARDLQMVQARYSGFDREDRPFVITAAVARQKPDLNDFITLDQPKGKLTAAGGTTLQLRADTGYYQPQPQLLDLFGDVALTQDNGNRFRSSSVHVNMAAGSAEGDEPITGSGPFGAVAAQGFRILDRGATIVFTGRTTLDLPPRQKIAP